MTNSKAFGGVLFRIRKEQGFSSAHQFFKSVGGSKSLGLSFMSYWDMERGKKLPKSWRLKSIMAALGVAQSSAKAQELVRAYFRALSGSDELLQILSAPAAPGADLPGRDLAEAAVHKALSQSRINLTLEQWKLRSRDLVTNICHNFLTNTAGWTTVRELSDVTKFKPEIIRKALKALAAGGLVDFSKDRARSRFAEKLIQLLPTTPATAAIKAAMRHNGNIWLADSNPATTKRLTVRMSKTNMEIYRQHLEKAVSLAGIYNNPGENRQNSDIYLIDASIFRFIPKD